MKAKDKLKQEINTIFDDAASGVVDLYKIRFDNKTHINWALVKKHILDAVDLYIEDTETMDVDNELTGDQDISWKRN